MTAPKPPTPQGISHPDCHGPEGHVCQQPSGRECVEDGCTRAAGTLWGPLWCPPCDEDRLDRISASLAEIAASIAPPSPAQPEGEG